MLYLRGRLSRPRKAIDLGLCQILFNLQLEKEIRLLVKAYFESIKRATKEYKLSCYKC